MARIPALMLDAVSMPMRPKRYHTIMRKRRWRRNDCGAHLAACPLRNLSISAKRKDHRPCVPSSEFSHHSSALRRTAEASSKPISSISSSAAASAISSPSLETDSMPVSLPRTSPPWRSEPLWSPPTLPQAVVCGRWAPRRLFLVLHPSQMGQLSACASSLSQTALAS